MKGVALVICFCAVFVTQLKEVSSSLARRSFTCKNDETLVRGPYIYDSSKTCGDIMSALISIYDISLVAECNRIMGYSRSIRHVKSAYMDKCISERRRIRYRAIACCPEKLTKLRCYSCRRDDPDDCNDGSLQTCSSKELCMTTFDYRAAGRGKTTTTATKGCVSFSQCAAKQVENKNRCKNNVADPSCTWCCNTPLCNENSRYRRITAFDAAVAADVCNKNNGKSSPCHHGGECTPRKLADPRFTCKCKEGFHGVVCQYDSCHPNRCGQHTCRRSTSAPYYKCYCSSGFFGDHCSDSYSLCRQNHCKNGGVCYQQKAGTRCKCADGFFGAECELQANTTCPKGALYVQDNRVFHTITESGSCTTMDSAVRKYYPGHRWQLHVCRHDQRLREFKNGRDGDMGKMSVNQVGFYQCLQGDSIMKYSYDMCCPACLSKPCANGGWCIQDGDSYFCKCRFGYAGEHCQHRTALCVISGDPHTTTFDRKHITFQGTCKYNAASLPENNPGKLPAFAVYNKNERRGGNTDVAYLKYMEVHVYGHVVRMARSNVVTVDGKKLPVGFDRIDLMAGKLTIQGSGPAIRVETDFGLVVENDGYWVGMIELPTEVGGEVSGMCGNNDGDPDNDVSTCGGEDVSDSPGSYSLVGKSCQINDPEDARCTTEIRDDPETCTEKEMIDLNKAEFCGLITQRQQSPFSSCLGQNPELLTHAENCALDVCANKKHPADAKEAACGSLMALAEACAHKGFQVDWRKIANCPMTCTGGTVYKFRGSPCPTTCTNPKAAEVCSQKDREVCACPDGLVLRGEQCVKPQECGCMDEDGKRYAPGDTWMSNDCKAMRTCNFCDDCARGYGRIEDKENECPPQSVCMGGKCQVPCEPLWCLSCHNQGDFACWTVGRYQKCPSGHTCFYSSEVLSTGRHVVNRGCAPFASCPAVNTADNYCDLGVPNPPAPEKPLSLCHRPDYAICSSKGDPHIISFDGLRIEDLRSGCVLTFARDGCTDGYVSDSPTFEVLIDPHFIRDETRVIVGHVKVNYNGLNVEMGLEAGIIKVNDETFEETVGSVFNDDTDGVNVEIVEGPIAVVTLDNGVRVLWDFNRQVSVEAPGSMKHKTCGICGNYGVDGKVGDFITGPADKASICPALPDILNDAGLTPGAQGTNITTQNEAFAMSWMVDVDENEAHCVNKCNLSP